MTSTRELLDFAIEAAWRAGRATLPHFQTGVDVEWKADASPVTVADLEAERLLRTLIERRFPGHAILGEELGEADRDSTHRWIVDPIDGTSSFIQGVPLYGTLVALEVSGDIVIGVVCFPALGDIVAAGAGLGCRWNGRPARVSGVARLADAVLSCTSAADMARLHPDAWRQFLASTRIHRGWSDCYGHCLVATGRADVMLDPIMAPWDCAALLPILREAGGTFTDWTGRATAHGGDAVSTNGLLFDQVMAIARRGPRAP